MENGGPVGRAWSAFQPGHRIRQGVHLIRYARSFRLSRDAAHHAGGFLSGGVWSVWSVASAAAKTVCC